MAAKHGNGVIVFQGGMPSAGHAGQAEDFTGGDDALAGAAQDKHFLAAAGRRLKTCLDRCRQICFGQLGRRFTIGGAVLLPLELAVVGWLAFPSEGRTGAGQVRTSEPAGRACLGRLAVSGDLGARFSQRHSPLEWRTVLVGGANFAGHHAASVV